MFSENSTAYMDEFSREFEEGMMEIIKRKARSQRMSANVCYREYIAHKQHFHMNATIWETLTDFIMYLGREGKCEVDETEKGWFVTWIDRDPETLRRQKVPHPFPSMCVTPPFPPLITASSSPPIDHCHGFPDLTIRHEERAKRERQELTSEEKHERAIDAQVKAARREHEDTAPAATELQRTERSQSIAFGVAPKTAPAKLKVSTGAVAFFGDDEPLPSSSAKGRAGNGVGGGSKGGLSSGAGSSCGSGSGGATKMMSGIQSLMAADMRRKESSARTDYWIRTGITVKVMNKQLRDGKYYKQKGTIEKVVERYTAHVRMQAEGELLKLDQDDLETVIPAEGGQVRIVNGLYRGALAKLTAINVQKYSISLKVMDGAHAGRALERIEYEDVCKIDQEYHA